MFHGSSLIRLRWKVSGVLPVRSGVLRCLTEKMETPVDGLWVVKIPASKTRPARLNLEINPLNNDGKPIKRKGLYVANKEMLVLISELLSDDKTFQLIGEMDRVNPKNNGSSRKKLEM